jgi:hypothetical protein
VAGRSRAPIPCSTASVVAIAGGEPGASGVVVLGFGATDVPLPLPPCRLRCEPALCVPLTLNQAGAALLAIRAPPDAALAFYTQALVLQTGGQLATTDALKITCR